MHSKSCDCQLSICSGTIHGSVITAGFKKHLYIDWFEQSDITFMAKEIFILCLQCAPASAVTK